MNFFWAVDREKGEKEVRKTGTMWCECETKRDGGGENR